MEDDDGRKYLTPQQAAEELRISPKTVSRWAGQGRLPCVVTLGGHRRFPREAIDEVRRRMTAR